MAYGNAVPTPYIQPQTGPMTQTVAPIQRQQQASIVGPLGFNEVSGIEGVRRYPLAPGATVPLKDSTSDLLFIKSCDMTGAPLPLRVIRMTDVTEEYQQNEGPVTRKEFNALSSSIGELKQMLEFLTSPDSKKEG